MYPSIYLESGFIQEYDKNVNDLSKSSIFSDRITEQKIESLKRIRDLILSSNVYCDLSEDEIKKSYTHSHGEATSLKDQVIHSGIKKDSYYENGRRLFLDGDKAFNRDFCFFTNDNFSQCEQNSKVFGRIILGKNFLTIPFFLNHTHSSESTDFSLAQTEKLKHPFSYLVIIDKYLFKDTKNLAEKMPNLIRAIELIMPDNPKSKVVVELITENIDSKLTNKISEGYQKIQNYFGEKISLKIYAPNFIAEVEASDRFILTNYALISVPHPFDRVSTISCNFYPSHPSDFSNMELHNSENGNLIKGYQTLKSKLQLAEKIKKATPKRKIGTVQYFWPIES